jgi:hypothetical protein
MPQFLSFCCGDHSACINPATRSLGFFAHLCGQEKTMKLVSLMIAGAALACSWTVTASAQQAVRPQWNYQGSAVCPEGYDYHAHSGYCRPQRY